jgi:hypothetical protein
MKIVGEKMVKENLQFRLKNELPLLSLSFQREKTASGRDKGGGRMEMGVNYIKSVNLSF